MRIQEERAGDVTVLTFAGEFDATNLPQATEKLDALIEVLRIRIVFNIGGLEFISSSALSFFIDAVKRVRSLGGQVVLSEPTRLFTSTVESLKIESFFEVFPTDEEAKTRLAGG